MANLPDFIIVAALLDSILHQAGLVALRAIHLTTILHFRDVYFHSIHIQQFNSGNFFKELITVYDREDTDLNRENQLYL